MEKIIDFLIKTLSQSERAAQRNAKNLCKYADIQAEFEAWMQTRQYPENGIIIEGYSAKKISEIAPFMNVAGVYNFMVTLREKPNSALQAIQEGFPRK